MSGQRKFYLNIKILLFCLSFPLIAHQNDTNLNLETSNLDMQKPTSPKPLSPTIDHQEWGRIEVNSKIFKDIRIWPNHVEEWDWSKHNTRHVPGIQIADLSDFIDKVDVIILSRGVDGVLQIKQDTIDYLKKLNKKFIIAKTEKAVKIYNDLAKQGQLVGALIHSTC